jgi:hypothetical protein
MMQRQKSANVALGLVATALVAALVAVACQDATTPTATANRPHFWSGGQCTTGKWTGGGRIDPPQNPDVADAGFGSEFLVPPLPPMTGKFTFGFNVFLGQDANQNCIVTKGEIQVNGHSQKLSWHVSIHDGVDAYDNRPVSATTFSDGHSGGVCLVVGLPSTGYMTARVNPQGGFQTVQFQVCDNDRGGRQNTGTDAMRWRIGDPGRGDTGGCPALPPASGETCPTYLTGGNIVEHGS